MTAEERRARVVFNAMVDHCEHQQEIIETLKAQLQHMQTKEARFMNAQVAETFRGKTPKEGNLTYITNQRNRFRRKYAALSELTKKHVRQKDGNKGPWVLRAGAEDVLIRAPRNGKKTRKWRLSIEGRENLLKNLEKARASKKKKRKGKKTR